MTFKSGESSSSFPATRISVLDRLRSSRPEARREAYGVLAAGYWKPMYKYLRLKWNATAEEAEDLTQGFLTAAFQKRYLENYDPDLARFRTFLRTCLDRYVLNQRKAARRIKRGGGIEFLALDFGDAEGEFRRIELRDPTDPAELFHQEFVRDLFARTLSELRAQLEAEGKEIQYQLFQRYDLDPEPGVTYAELAKEFGIPITQVTNFLAAARRAFRQRALDKLRELSGSDEEFRADARELLGVEVE